MSYTLAHQIVKSHSLCPEFYMPMCRSCHVRFDRGFGSHTNRRGRAFRPKPVQDPKTTAEWELYLQHRKR